MSRVEGGQGDIWHELSERGRELNEAQVIVLCLFAISICLTTIMYSLNRQSVWRLEREHKEAQAAMKARKNRMAALKAKQGGKKTKRSK